LEKEGVDVEEMFANPDDIAEKQWAEIEEDYGVLGKMMKKLMSQQQSNVQQIQQAGAEAGADLNPELQEALNANPEVLQWRDGDVNRWTEALRLDNELRKSPEWQGRITAERFAHVVEQTKKAFGDPLKRAKEIIH